MKIVIFGAGYVGLTTAACFAEVGNSVTCIDIAKDKINQLNEGIIPIYEPGMEKLIYRNLQNETLHFTTNTQEPISTADIIFIAVGTPFDNESQKPDLTQVQNVAKIIAAHMKSSTIVVIKSTVPVGTTVKIKTLIKKEQSKKNKKLDFFIAFNPEFLKEGSAINDFLNPDRIILGIDSTYTNKILHKLYASFISNKNKIICMDIVSAELTKYAANAMLATKVSLMNELSLLADKIGANIESVRQGISHDPRIGCHFISAGCGYGGSCFSKDINSLVYSGEKNDLDLQIMKAVNNVNERQKRLLFNKIMIYFNNNLHGKTFALWGLAFKPNSDDIREAPSLVLIEALWSQGATIKAYDPKAYLSIQKHYGSRKNLLLVNSMYEAIENADALIICTEWGNFKSPDFDKIKHELKSPVIFDGRNIYDPEQVNRKNLKYIGIGVRNKGEESCNYNNFTY